MHPQIFLMNPRTDQYPLMLSALRKEMPTLSVILDNQLCLFRHKAVVTELKPSRDTLHVHTSALVGLPVMVGNTALSPQGSLCFGKFAYFSDWKSFAKYLAGGQTLKRDHQFRDGHVYSDLGQMRF